MNHIAILLVGLCVAFAPGQLSAQPAPAERREIAVIPISKHHSAVENARILDKVFNGTGPGRQTRIVVFALPFTNCVIVKGSRLDVLTARDLLYVPVESDK